MFLTIWPLSYLQIFQYCLEDQRVTGIVFNVSFRPWPVKLSVKMKKSERNQVMQLIEADLCTGDYAEGKKLLMRQRPDTKSGAISEARRRRNGRHVTNGCYDGRHEARRSSHAVTLLGGR